MLVLALGILGIAAVQTRALGGNNSSMARSMATVDSYSIIDAMRITPTASYSKSFSADSCPTGTSYLDNQVNTWCQQLGRDFGAVSTTKGNISCDANIVCTVTVQFDDSHAGADGSTDATALKVITKAQLQ